MTPHEHVMRYLADVEVLIDAAIKRDAGNVVQQAGLHNLKQIAAITVALWDNETKVRSEEELHV